MSKQEQKFNKIIDSVLERIYGHKSVQVGSQDAALIILVRIEERLKEQNELLRKMVGSDQGTAHEVYPDPGPPKKKKWKLFR